MKKYPICPYCNHKLRDEDLWSDAGVSANDADISLVSCPNCKKQYETICIHEIKFISSKIGTTQER